MRPEIRLQSGPQRRIIGVRISLWVESRYERKGPSGRRRCIPMHPVTALFQASPATWRHFEGSQHLADLKVACSSHAGRATKKTKVPRSVAAGVPAFPMNGRCTTLRGVGHCYQVEAPEFVAEALESLLATLLLRRCAEGLRPLGCAPDRDLSLQDCSPI